MNITVEKIKALMDDTGCEEFEAKTALEIAGGNFNKAIYCVGAMLNYITAYKTKIVLQNDNIFGLIHIITNNKNLDLLRFSVVMTYNPIVYEQNIEVDWFSFEKKLYSYRLVEGVIEQYTKSIETNLKDYISNNLKDNKIINCKDMKMVLETYFAENNLQIEIVAQVLTLRDFKKLPNYFPDIVPTETISSKYSAAIELETVVFEDFFGKKIENLSVGDKILAKIIDTRDIAHYIGHLIGAKKDQIMIPIPTEVKSIEKKEKEYILYLKYSDLIFGKAHVVKGTNLKILDTKDTTWSQKNFLPYYHKDIKIDEK